MHMSTNVLRFFLRFSEEILKIILHFFGIRFKKLMKKIILKKFLVYTPMTIKLFTAVIN
jgi:hypothetical protein